MIYFKSIVVGLATGLMAAVIWIAAVFFLPLLLPFLMARVSGDGSGGGGASVGFASIAGVALAGFVAGFYWRLRRTGNR